MKQIFITILLIFIWLPAFLFAQVKPVAVLEYFEDPNGDMFIIDDTGVILDHFNAGDNLPPGFSIVTGSGFAEIKLYPSGTILKLADNTDFSIAFLQGLNDNPSNEIYLLAGKMRTIVTNSTGIDYYYVRTPSAVMLVRGTDFINIVEPGNSKVVVREGVVEVIPFRGSPVLAAANQSVNTGTEVLQVAELAPDQVSSIFGEMDFKKLSPGVISEAPVLSDEKRTEAPEESSFTPVDLNDSKLASIFRNLFGMEIGIMAIGGISYSKVVVQPVIELEKFSMGLYLPLIYTDGFFDPSEWYQPEGNHEWSFGSDQGGDLQDIMLDILKDTMLKIRFLEYGKKDMDPFYITLGNLNNMSIGHGAIMNNYANDNEFPAIREVGLNTGFDTGVLGMELVGDNLADPSIVAGRLFINPFKGYEPFQIGLTGLVDFFPARSSDVTKILYGDPWLLTFGVDFEFFKISKENFNLMFYGDFSTFAPIFRTDTASFSAGIPGDDFWFNNGKFSNYGIVGGLRGNVMSFTWAFEYRISTGIYRPALYNALYDRNKIEYLNEIVSYIDDSSGQGTVMGIFGEVGIELKDRLVLTAGYYRPWEISDGRVSFPNNDKLNISLAFMDGLFPRLPISGRITYERTKLIETFTGDSLSLFDAGTVVQGEIIFSLSSALDIVAGASTAVLTDGDGDIVFEENGVTPDVDPVFRIETRIHF